MKNTLLSAAAAGILLLTVPAYAQTNTSTSTSTATATNAGGGGGISGQGGAGGRATGGKATGGTAAGGRATGGQSSSTNGGNATGGNTFQTQTYNPRPFPNTPDVFAPSISGGNVCTVGASIGLAGMGAGIAGGFSKEDVDCTRRQNAALFSNVGRRDVAIEILCQNMDVRYAMARAETPCVVDRIRFHNAGAPGW